MRGKITVPGPSPRRGRVVETCKLDGVDPQRYFTDLLTRLVNGWSNSRNTHADVFRQPYATDPDTSLSLAEAVGQGRGQRAPRRLQCWASLPRRSAPAVNQRSARGVLRCLGAAATGARGPDAASGPGSAA